MRPFLLLQWQVGESECDVWELLLKPVRLSLCEAREWDRKLPAEDAALEMRVVWEGQGLGS